MDILTPLKIPVWMFFLQIYFLVVLTIPVIANEAPIELAQSEARKKFYQCIENEKEISAAIHLFKQISQTNKKYKGICQTYQGVLITLKGKHAFWPHQKFMLVKKGLSTMDAGLRKASNDLEAIFVHSSTCYYLPFFFGRADDAQRGFRKVIKLLPNQYQNYEQNLIINVIRFLLSHIHLTNKELKVLEDIKVSLIKQ